MVEFYSNKKTNYKQFNQTSNFRNFTIRSRLSLQNHTVCVGWQCSGVVVQYRTTIGFKYHKLDYWKNFRKDLKIRQHHRIKLQANRSNNQTDEDRRQKFNKRPQVRQDEDDLNEQIDLDEVPGDQLFLKEFVNESVWQSLIEESSSRQQINFSSKGLPDWLASSLPNIIWQINRTQIFPLLKIVPFSLDTTLTCSLNRQSIDSFVIPIRGPVIISTDINKRCDILISTPTPSSTAKVPFDTTSHTPNRSIDTHIQDSTDISHVETPYFVSHPIVNLRFEVVIKRQVQQLIVVVDGFGKNHAYLNGITLPHKSEVEVREGDVLNIGSTGSTLAFSLAPVEQSDDISSIGIALHTLCQDVKPLEYHQNAQQDVNQIKKQKGRESAVFTLKRYLKDMPTSWQLWWLWGVWEAKDGHSSKARQLFRAAYEALEVFIFRQNSSFLNLSFKQRRLFSKEITYILRDWGLMEWQGGNQSSARRLWALGVSFGGKFQGTLTKSLYSTWVTSELGKGDVFRARKIAYEAVRMFPKNPDILNVAGFVEIVGNRFDRAVKILRLAASIQQDHKYALSNLAKAEWECGNIEVARNIFGKLMQQHPFSTKILHRWSVQEDKAGNIIMALKMQIRALEIDPLSSTTVKNREHLACMYMSLNQHLLAKPILQEGLKRHKGHAMLHTAMAQLELDGLNFGECQRHLDAVLKKQPEYVDALKILAQMYNQQGLKHKATKTEKDIRKLCTKELLSKQRLRT